MREKPEDSEIQVKLKPFMGIRPGVYLIAIYSLVLLIIMFFLLLCPGLINNGSMLIVKSEPAGAAIRVDDIYMGLHGSKIFVPKGTHTIDVVMPGFESQSDVVQIDGRVFASLFFPKIKRVEYTLKPADSSPDGIASAFALYAADFASWTFAGEPTAAWQVPMSLSEGAYRIGPYLTEAKSELNEILKAASRFAVTKAALRDLIRAKILIDNKGSSPSSVSLISSISDTLTFLSENRQDTSALFELLPRETLNAIKSTNWYNNTQILPETGNTDTVRRTAFYNMNFISVPQSNAMICETPVSRSLFETFLNENPEYREQKTDYYPDEISNLPEIDRNAVTGITWHAAQEFCKWLSLRVTSPNMEIRLPSEKEWVSAAGRFINSQGLIWEWCADPYAPLNFKASPKAIKAVGSSERSLRRKVSDSTGERASLPADLSSPFVTFRLILAPKE